VTATFLGIEYTPMKRYLFGLILLAMVVLTLWSYTGGGIIAILTAQGLSSEERLSLIREYLQDWGVVAPVAYMFIVAGEVVVAPIPGILLYLPGGAIFGWMVGGSMALAGNVLGAAIACQGMRMLGRDRIEGYFDTSAIRKYQHAIERNGFWVVFLLRINPLTSNDIVSYAAGLTRIPLWKVLAGTFLGMAPLSYLQAYFAQEIFTTFPFLIYPLILLVIAYVFYLVRLLRRSSRTADCL
jgi:uncharacterized membrane protein YdjX (TVP38/TMEM64 family)